MALDCRTCGACCCNLDGNREEGLIDYVEVTDRDALFLVPDLLEQFAVKNNEGAWHLKLTPEQRCVALEGELGRQVSCRIYALRPSGCRRVQPGTTECLEARAERGLNPP
jgi:Fe-S-cluster containining protein